MIQFCTYGLIALIQGLQHRGKQSGIGTVKKQMYIYVVFLGTQLDFFKQDSLQLQTHFTYRSPGDDFHAHIFFAGFLKINIYFWIFQYFHK
jgi:hypothetical protein